MSIDNLRSSLARGGNGWALNRVRTDALSALINDLQLREASGFAPANESYCVAVKRTLDGALEAFEARHRGAYWAIEISERLSAFRETYAQWNDVVGTGDKKREERRVLVGAMKKCRGKIAKKLRNRQIQLELASLKDAQFSKKIIGPMADLAQALAPIFPEVAFVMRHILKKYETGRRTISDIEEIRHPTKSDEEQESRRTGSE